MAAQPIVVNDPEGTAALLRSRATTGPAILSRSSGVAPLGTSILTNVTTGMRLLLEIAWGADLTDLTGASWTWTSVTPDVQLKSGWGIDLQVGRADESSITQPATLTVTLDNTAGAYSLGPQSSNYPNVRRNTPVRLRISTDSGVTWTVHFQGNAVGFTPQWDSTGEWATVVLTASGPLRQLNQGTLAAQSAYTAWTLANQDAHLIGYWPLEDGVYAATAASAIGGTAATVIPDGFTGLGQANSNGSPFACAGVLPNGGNFNGPVPSYSNSGVQQFMWLYAPTGSINPNSYFMFITTASGTIRTWAIAWTSGGNVLVQGYAGTVFPFGTQVFSQAANITSPALSGIAALMSFTITNQGADVNWKFEVQPIGAAVESVNQTRTGQSSGAVTNVTALAPSSSTGSPAGTVGHMTFRNSYTALTTYNTATTAYSGEDAVTRLTRVANAAGIPLTVLTDTATETSANPLDTLGSQYADTVSNLLREIETTTEGLLFDGSGIGLNFVTRLKRESQQPSMTVDATSGVVVMPFAPVDDDQRIINSAVVQRRNGSSATYQDTTGTSGANAVGIYQDSVTINPSVDSALSAYAQWLVHLGTADNGTYRYPTWTFNLEKRTSLIASWLACFPSCRIDVTNIDSVRSQHPTGTIRNVLEGWREQISQFQWHVTANTTSYEPWRVVALAAATGSTTDSIGRYESDGSTVTANVSAGGTSISVTTPSGPIWTQSSVTADDFPLTVAINGYPVTVTAISGAASPQTFTVSALAHAVTAGNAVTIYQNSVLGM